MEDNNENTPEVPQEQASPLVISIESQTETPLIIGQTKWFSDKLGYGFITICEGSLKGKDVFVHHSGVKPLNSNYKTLKKGEYIQFAITNGSNGMQAINVTGIYGGPLMCDFVSFTPRRRYSYYNGHAYGNQPASMGRTGYGHGGERGCTESAARTGGYAHSQPPPPPPGNMHA